MQYITMAFQMEMILNNAYQYYTKVTILTNHCKHSKQNINFQHYAAAATVTENKE